MPLASHSQQCKLDFFVAAPPSYWALSPTIANAALAEPAGMAAVNAAGAVWNGTDAGGRLLGWNGLVGVSDCPSFSHPIGKRFQVTALSFDSAHIWCPVASFYQTNVIEVGGYIKKGFADYNGPYVNCMDCGSKSVVINLNFAYSVSNSPAAGEVDLQSLLSHEFGHVLGFAHRDYGHPCGAGIPDYYSQTCYSNPRINVMSNWVFPGTTCQQSLTTDDINNANSIY